MNEERKQRVQIAPHFDLWMRGDRFGTVIANRPERARVLMDITKKQFWFRWEDLTLID